MRRRAKIAARKINLHRAAVVTAAITATVLYMAGLEVEPSWITYCVQLPALVILAVTALARVNDIREDRTGVVWQIRRIGLTLVGVGAISLMFNPFGMYGMWPTWKGIALTWGFALSWITSPGMPPFWKYVSGEAKLPKAMT